MRCDEFLILTLVFLFGERRVIFFLFILERCDEFLEGWWMWSVFLIEVFKKGEFYNILGSVLLFKLKCLESDVNNILGSLFLYLCLGWWIWIEKSKSKEFLVKVMFGKKNCCVWFLEIGYERVG